MSSLVVARSPAYTDRHLARTSSQDPMEPISIYEARNNLSRLIEAAIAGEDVILTKRGEPVVKIVRIEPRQYSGAAIAAWLAEDRPWRFSRSTPEEIEAIIRENREMGE